MKTLTCTLILFLLSAPRAYAQDAVADSNNGSQFLYQSPAGAIEVTPTLGLGKLTAKEKDPSIRTKVTLDTTEERAMIAYGINEMFAVSAELGFRKTVTNLSPNPNGDHGSVGSGMEDPVLAFRGRAAMGGGSLRYGALLNLSLADQKTKSNGDYNNYSGRTGLTPFVGFETLLSPDTIVGGRMKYTLPLMDGKSSSQSSSGNTTSSTFTGGEVFSLDVFYEMLIARVRLGADLGLDAMRARSVKESGVTRDEHDPTTKMHLAIYVPVTITKAIVILPQLTYEKYTAFNRAYGADSIDDVVLEVGGRFTF